MEQTDRGTSAHASLKEKQREERRTLILQMAEEVLMEKGYYETSIDEIATRVGIAKGTVYLHFSSKEDLVVAILLRDLQHLLVEIDEVAATDATAHDKVEAILHCAYDTVKDLSEQLATKVSAVLDQGKAAGEFDASIPTLIMLSAFFSLLSPREYEQLVTRTQMEKDELINQLGRLYLKGITRL